MEEVRLACSFLLPVLRDSDRRPHEPIQWRLLQDGLRRAFGGLTGPEEVLWYRSRDPVPGTWLPEESAEPVEDESFRYTVAVPEGRLDELRALLRRAGNSFDQRVVYLEVRGVVELLDVRLEDGFLEG